MKSFLIYMKEARCKVVKTDSSSHQKLMCVRRPSMLWEKNELQIICSPIFRCLMAEPFSRQQAMHLGIALLNMSAVIQHH